MWFDVGELDAIPKRAANEIVVEKWKEELRHMQRRRENGDFYARMILRRSFSPFEVCSSTNQALRPYLLERQCSLRDILRAAHRHAG
ncbi:MAG TPA: hypothetical protein VN812_05285 [Candidatus Acidoferrales bacterium]|nr:hypothetical protein [Candidatus Acidoferrales bacterium]